MITESSPPLYGLLAEFDDPDDLVAAAQRVYDEGYRNIDAFSPFPVHGLPEAIGVRGSRLPMMVLLGGIAGGLGGYGLQYWYNMFGYPYNVGGRPLHSWPAFIPVTFETTILAAALTAVFGMLALNGLPQPYHPVFNVPRFELASRTHFFLLIESKDPMFNLTETRSFLENLSQREVAEVEY